MAGPACPSTSSTRTIGRRAPEAGLIVIGPVAVIGAPSAIGIRPYDDGRVRRLDLAPGVLREHGVVTRLAASDLGDVTPPERYGDPIRPEGRVRNQDDVVGYASELSERVAAA